MTVVAPDETPLAHQRQQRLRLWLLLAPGALWLFFFFVLPLLIVMLYSFATPGPTGNVIWRFNFDSYITLMGKDLYFNAYYRSLWVGLQTTVICLLIGYPLALYMTLAEAKQRNVLLFLVLIPFWTNFLVRTYAWMIILSNNGLINELLQWLGFAKQLLYPSAGAVLVGLIYGNLPFMVLPLYASLARFDFTLMEAGADLGAGRWRSFWRIMFPLTVPGVVAGSVLVFIPTVGQFVVSDLLGGAKVDLLGNLLQRLFTRSNPPNWPLGSALALVFMFLLTLIVIIYFRTTTEEDR
ncbi:MAG: ABC transporter permease [Chloroflexia bacterium]|nr:ABC transporter permease [Chloroflexia bacterium]